MNVRLDPPSRRAAPRRRRGQSLTEAAVITFLVAVGTIGAVGLFGDNLRQLFGASADAVSAQNGGGKASTGLLKWSMKGSSTQGNPGGTAGAPPRGEGHGNPGGTSNKGAHPGGPGGNPGGTTNSTPAHPKP
jgi:pilus assembly protein Flp/PilA